VDASGCPSQYDLEYSNVNRKKCAIATQRLTDYPIDHIVVDIMKGFDGYLWIFPSKYGSKYGSNIGIGYWRSKLEKMDKILKDYLDWIGATPIKSTGGLLGVGINRPFLRRTPDGKTVVLIGDAAGLVDPFFAEGMTKAVLSAKIMSKNIHNLKNYEKEYLNRLRTHYIISNILYWIRRISPGILIKLVGYFDF